MTPCSFRRSLGGRGDAGFTLVEILVSLSIVLIIMAVVASATAMVGRAWKGASDDASSFESARAGFEALTQTLSQATLGAYWDYVDSSGNPRTAANANTFSPAGYQRASGLHFVSGSASSLVPGGTAATTQGHAIFFQAVLGRSSVAAYQPLASSLNCLGFYVQFSDDKSDWPDFIASHFMGTTGNSRFRLMEWVQQTQNMHVYDSTAQPLNNTAWFSTAYLPAVGASPAAPQESARILAENVTLLVILPKLPPGDEIALSGSASGTLLCPNYEYDSRAWCSNYTGPISGSPQYGLSHGLRDLMRNQLPPLLDVVMVAVSGKDMGRLQARSGAGMPGEVKVPQGLFQNSANLAADIQAYETQLTNSHVTFKTFWSTVPVNSAKWSAN